MADETKSWWTRTKEWFGYDLPLEAFTDSNVAADTAVNVPLSQTGTFQPPARASLPYVDARNALTINAVFSAVRLLSTAVSQLPVQVQRNGRVVKATPSIIRQPDTAMTQTVFLNMCVSHMTLWGNAYLRIIRDVDRPDGNILGVRLLNPELVYVTIGLEGRKVYLHVNETLQEWQVINLMTMPEFDPATQIVRGKSPVQKIVADLQQALDLNAYMANFYTNNGIPNGILTVKEPLADGTADALRQKWFTNDANSGLQIISGDASYQQVGLSPESIQFHASANKIVCDVARAYGIPDRYLLAAIERTSMSYQNMTDADRQLFVYGLSSYIQQIEDALSLLIPRGQNVVLNTNAFLRGTPAERYAAFAALGTVPFLTVNEKRLEAGLDPIAGGDALTAPIPNEGAPTDN